MVIGIITLIVNLIKIIYSFLYTFIIILFDYNKNILELFLENLNVYGSIENIDKYYKFKQYHTNGIGIFNHTSLLDGIILMKELQEPISFVCAKNILISLCKSIVDKWNCLVIDPKQSTTRQITETVLNRNKNEPILFIAPSGGDGMIQKDKENLCNFKTGAFVSLSPVLPVIIKYNPHIYTDESTMIESCINLINSKKKVYKVKILDTIYPRKSDTIESFRDYVYNKMNYELKNTTVDIIEQSDNKKIFIIFSVLLILSYILFSNNLEGYIVILLITILLITICLRNKNYIYDYIYKNLIYFYGIGLTLYSLLTQNYLLFINSILYPVLYNILNKIY